MGFFQITEKTYCSGYKNIIFTINLNLTMFLFNPFYIYIFVFVLCNMKWKKRNSKNKLKFSFHCTRHSVRLFFCQHGVMNNHEIDWINDSWSPNNNALLGMCVYSFHHEPFYQSHACWFLRIGITLLWYFSMDWFPLFNIVV